MSENETWCVAYDGPTHEYLLVGPDYSGPYQLLSRPLPEAVADAVVALLRALPCPLAYEGLYCYSHFPYEEPAGPGRPEVVAALEAAETALREAVRSL